MSSKWIDDRINAMYSHVRSRTLSALKSKYPDLNFTEDDTSNTKAKFPTVYMFFDWTERQSTLDGGVINAVYMQCRTQISVTKAQGNNVAREVNTCVRDLLTELGFKTSGGTLPIQSGDVKIMVTNYQREVGFSDPLII